MTITASIPFLFMLVGAILWLFSEKTGKWSNLGYVLFAAGAFAFAFACAGKTVALLK
jgi:hypothetical protein